MGYEDGAFRQAGEDIFARIGTSSGTYQPEVGAAMSGIHLHIERDVQLEPDGFNLSSTGKQITAECLLHEVGGIPRPGGYFLDENDVKYRIRSILENDGFFVLCAVNECS